MAVDSFIDRVLAREGGYVNSPADRGGPTKYGITLATLHEWRGKPVSAFDVQMLSVGEAKAIYRAKYLDHPGFDAVTDPELQELLFDTAVNSGPAMAVKALQAALDVPVDGALGPVTKAALANCRNLPALFWRVKCERYEALLRFVGVDPQQAIFAQGWANRLDQFERRLS
jgi:lysozyme family protein